MDGSLLAAGISRTFRVVRDNRLAQNANKESEPPLPQSTTSTSDLVVVNVAEKGYVYLGSCLYYSSSKLILFFIVPLSLAYLIVVMVLLVQLLPQNGVCTTFWQFNW